MRKEEKSAIQERIIEKLNKEIEYLKKENEDIQTKIDMDEYLANKDYDEVKNLMILLNVKKKEYEELIEETKEIKSEYEKTLKEINELKLEYVKDMNTVMKDIQKGTKKLK